MLPIVQPNFRTLETGGGHTTVAFAALGAHHTCINPDVEGCQLIAEYLQQCHVSSERIKFILKSSDAGFLRLDSDEKIDVAFIDGCHGFPFPSLDWHYIDQHLKVGGILAVDDIDIPSVDVLCQFLEKNETYTLEDTVLDTAFYQKIRHESQREWPFQKFNSIKLNGIGSSQPQSQKHSLLSRLKNFNK